MNPPPPPARLFVAIALPDSVRADLARHARPIEGVTWTPPEQLHLTLRFLGELDSPAEERVRERLRGIRVEPFILPLEGLGTFPPQVPARVLWLGIGRGHPRLFQLRQRLDDALIAAGLTLDLRTFQPHVTLARMTELAGPALAARAKSSRQLAAPPFRVAAIDLCASTLRPEGAVHTLQERFPLAGPTA